VSDIAGRYVAFWCCARFPQMHPLTPQHLNTAIALPALQIGMTSTANSESVDCLLWSLLLSLYCRLAQPVKCAYATGEGGLKHKILPSNPRSPSSETLTQAAPQLLQETGPMRARRHIVHYPIGTARPSTAVLCTARQGEKGEAFISTPHTHRLLTSLPNCLDKFGCLAHSGAF
jgi:hypothetical protein